jgi:4-hydroxy-3-methylbut-2-enyl diphosphate reductase
VDDETRLQQSWLDRVQCIGVTAGASAPDILIRRVIDRLKSWGAEMETESRGRAENVVFSLPRALKKTG